MDARVKPGHDVARTRCIALQPLSQRRLASIRSQIIAATSGPPSDFTARMPVGEVTLISVRKPSITSMPTKMSPRSRSDGPMRTQISRSRAVRSVSFGVPPPGAYNKDVGQFILPYEAVRTADAPDDVLMQFLQSTYEACADNAKWDRRALERQPTVK